MRAEKAVTGTIVTILTGLLLARGQAAAVSVETTVYTPFGSTVEAWFKDEMSPRKIIEYNLYVRDVYPDAVLLGDASRTYNCHAYAWHVSEGGDNVWIGVSGKEENTYWEDGSYLPVAAEAEAAKVSYASDDHSAVTTDTPGWYISKWGSLPLMFHAWDYCPYNYSRLMYYEPNPGDPRFVTTGKECWDPEYTPEYVHGFIQDAIDAAADGDVVIVCPGRYDENINFAGKAITVRSTVPGDPDVVEATVIDGGGAGTVVVFESGEDENSVLAGFTIRNGAASSAVDLSGFGGGIRCVDSSSPGIANNTITGNAAKLGGGVYCGNTSSPALMNNAIVENLAGDGGGIYCVEDSSPALVNTIVSNNSAEGPGGGMYCRDGSSPLLINNTVYGNLAYIGGGIYCVDGSSPLLVNTILWANEAEESAPQVYSDDGSSPDVTYCDVQGGYGQPEDHNINDDPLFVAPGSNTFKLTADSPCIDAGTNDAPALPEKDFEGDDRIFNGDGYGFTVVDMGVDEYKSNSVPGCGSGEPGMVRYVTRDLEWPGFTPECFYDRIQDALEDAGDGDTILVGPGTYYETIQILMKEVTLRSDADGDPATYDPAPAMTIIDGGQAGDVVYFEETEEKNVVLAGFTIRNGLTGYGGAGIHCYLSSPTLNGNIIHGNTVYGAGDGGGIECVAESSPTLINNVIYGNSANGNGGGVYCEAYSSPILINNTIYGNAAANGGGMYCEDESYPVIINSIFWGNEAVAEGAQIYGDGPVVSYCDVQGGWEGEGNMDVDPGFIGEMPFDYHLSGCSPCIDKGTGGADVPDMDIDGEPRPIDVPDLGIDGKGEGYDIGADEVPLENVLECCPWNVLIASLVNAEPAGPTPVNSRAPRNKGRPARNAAMGIGFEEAQALLYSIRDRMIPEMRARADGANPALLCLMRGDPLLKARMVEALGTVIPYLNHPDKPIPGKIRSNIIRISYIVGKMMKRERIDSPAMKRLLPRIRKIARDRKVNTVNRMLKKYGNQSPAR